MIRWILFSHLLNTANALTEERSSTSEVFNLAISRLENLPSVVIHNDAFYQCHERKSKRNNQEQVSGLHVADSRHGVVGVLKEEDFCQKSCDTQGASVTNLVPIHPKWQPRHHRAKDAGKEDTNDVMADPSSHEEGYVKIIEPTWNVENVNNTSEIRYTQ